jgi:hypothetical protein
VGADLIGECWVRTTAEDFEVAQNGGDYTDLRRCYDRRMRPLVITLLLLSMTACAKDERPSDATTAIADAMKQTLEQTRDKHRLRVEIRLTHDEQPSPADLEMRRKLKEEIEREHIGRIVSTSSDAGHVDIEVEVSDTAGSIARIRTMLQGAGVLNRSTIKVASTE